MTKISSQALYDAFSKKFDLVGIIESETYRKEALKLHKNISQFPYETMVVVGLTYPYRVIRHTKTHLVPSFYTFGSDYHQVLKQRMKEVLNDFDTKYELNVDNHPLDERLAATLAGLGFFGKNQLIINQAYGSYFFLGMALLDLKIDHEIKLDVTDDCGACRICLDACPTKALDENQYHIEKCMSYYNQSKKVLSTEEMDSNYCLFGCDICQMVCPKNINKGQIVHEEFELNGKEMVSILDLFLDSDKTFNKKYETMSYLWKGKTILMRNALMLLRKQKNTDFLDLIKQSKMTKRADWYEKTSDQVIHDLENLIK
ncbi:MAG: 4Fe-4S double cluster binding domain-containing protein [Acholeplasmataceae bacterium]|nr:epoxyqueuosine reductase [Acholeplasmataceae bacterium]